MHKTLYEAISELVDLIQNKEEWGPEKEKPEIIAYCFGEDIVQEIRENMKNGTLDKYLLLPTDDDLREKVYYAWKTQSPQPPHKPSV